MSKHPHYDLIVQWANDPERWRVERVFVGDIAMWETVNGYAMALDLEHHYKYRLIDRHAEPIDMEPEIRQVYFLVNIVGNSLVTRYTWQGSVIDLMWLRRRLLYRTREAAEARAREIIESGGGEV